MPTVDRDDLVLYYAERGDPTGPPVVLLHGLTMSSVTMERLAASLDDHRVVLLDLHGHGKSTKPRQPDRYLVSEFADDVVALARPPRDRSGRDRRTVARRQRLLRGRAPPSRPSAGPRPRDAGIRPWRAGGTDLLRRARSVLHRPLPGADAVASRHPTAPGSAPRARARLHPRLCWPPTTSPRPRSCEASHVKTRHRRIRDAVAR